MEIILYDSHCPPKTPNIFRLSGYGLIILSFFVLLVSLGPVVVQEIGYQFRQKFSAFSSKANHFPVKFPPLEESQQQQVAEEAQHYGVGTDFSIVIPKIAASAKVIPNVDPGDENDYKSALKQGVGHAAGTKFPGNKGVIYLFAHSTNSPVNISRYNAVFYLLKELKKDDEVIIFFAGRKYLYKVSERVVTTPDDTRWLTAGENEELLILQTCWPPGTTQKRLLVIAKPV